MSSDVVENLVNAWDNVSDENMRKVVLAILDEKRIDLIRSVAGDEQVAADTFGLTPEGMKRQYAARARSTRCLIAHIEQAMRLVREAPMLER